MKKIVVISILTFWAFVVHAQDYAFKVIAFKGNATVQGQKLKVGSTISPDESVVVQEGAYLALVHKSGKTHEINKSGTFTAKDMEAAVAKNNQGNVYVAMVVNELTGNVAEVNRKPKTGSVERALGREPIGIQLDKSSHFYTGKPVAISWYLKDQGVEKIMEGDQFKVSVYNMFNDEIATVITKNNYAIFDFSNVKFDSENTGVVYKITSMKNPTRITSLQYSLGPADAEVSKVVEQELAAGDYEDTPLGNLILANFFEENGLYPNAQAAYLKAIEQTDSEVFKQQYQSFLDRKLFSRSARMTK